MKSASRKLVWLPLIFIAGCGSSTESVQSLRDLKTVGLAYSNFTTLNHNRGPKDLEEFKGQLDRMDEDATSPGAPYRKIKEGQFVFHWNISYMNDKNNPTSECVLAYEKDAPRSGGWVLFVDGSCKHVKATEFGALKQAEE